MGLFAPDFVQSILSTGSLLSLTVAYGGAAASAAVPRIGPGRALIMAVRSRFRSAKVKSDRHSSINLLRNRLDTIDPKRGGYVVVRGPKAAGKTCLVDTALQRRWGVSFLSVYPGKRADDIVDDALREIIRYYLPTRPQFQARRVIWFYNLFASMFALPPPTIVLQVSEVKENNSYPELVPAVRALSETYGLLVVVDSSDNSMPPGAEGVREVTLRAKLMSKDQITKEIFPALYNKLTECDLADVTWAVLGGSPGDWTYLQKILDPFTTQESDISISSPIDAADAANDAKIEQDKKLVKEIVLDFLQVPLGKAVEDLKGAIVEAKKHDGIMEKIEDLKTKNFTIMPAADLAPKFYKAFRLTDQKNLTPATPAMKVLLRMGWDTPNLPHNRETFYTNLKEVIDKYPDLLDPDKANNDEEKLDQRV